MRTSEFLRQVVVVSIAAAIFAMPAHADKGGQGKGGGKPDKSASHGKSHGGGQGNKGGGDGNPGSKGKGPKKFESSERSSIQSWYREEYTRTGNCPPGLARKNNGCMPPGQAKRMWNVGSPLPPDLSIEPLPPMLRGALVAPLPGYDYGYVGGEVIIFGVQSRVVIDFVPAY